MGAGLRSKGNPTPTQKKCYLHPKAIESASRGVSSCQADISCSLANIKKNRKIFQSVDSKCRIHTHTEEEEILSSLEGVT